MTTESEPGSNTLAEILSQPRCWEDCFKALDEQDQIARVLKHFGHQTSWLFVGCGSSYYIAQVAAASWTRLTGLQALAVPASDLLLYPDSILSDLRPCQPVLISRSGRTSEVLKAAEFLESAKDIRTLAISCVSGQPLEKIATGMIHVLPADEKSTVMTRSFSSMLLGLQSLAAAHSYQSEFTGALRKLPKLAPAAFDPLPARIREFVESHDFADYVFLAQGPFYGVASESMLKVKEMSCSYAQCFHTLEFRHGPKSIVSSETLVTFLMSETGYDAEREVLEEVKSLGGVTLAVTNRADSPVRGAADFVVELNLDVPEYARLAPYIFMGQLLGLMTGLKKGLDPDRPRNLTRAVILQG
jgi:glutamine---fructose-6-phosphate transaminase (isomerizing)